MRRFEFSVCLFPAIQLAVLVCAAATLHGWGVFRGIVPAQAALIAIGLSVGPVRRSVHHAGAILFAFLLVLVITTLVLAVPMGSLLGINGNGWQFLTWIVRGRVVGGLMNGDRSSASLPLRPD